MREAEKAKKRLSSLREAEKAKKRLEKPEEAAREVEGERSLKDAVQERDGHDCDCSLCGIGHWHLGDKKEKRRRRRRILAHGRWLLVPVQGPVEIM